MLVVGRGLVAGEINHSYAVSLAGIPIGGAVLKVRQFVACDADFVICRAVMEIAKLAVAHGGRAAAEAVLALKGGGGDDSGQVKVPMFRPSRLKWDIDPI